MKILGLGHYSRTGKDSLANACLASLKEQAPHLRVAKRSFAWKMKEITHELYGWAGLREPAYYDTREGEQLRNVVLPHIGKTPVEIWVAFGTPAIREQVYDKTWIDYLLKSDLNLDVLIIPDVRFPNEAEAVQAAGGTLGKVVRPGYGPKDTVADRALLGFNGWDYIVGGSGRMAELESWGSQFACFLAGGPRPIQTDADRRYCMSVEVL